MKVYIKKEKKILGKVSDKMDNLANLLTNY